MLVTTPQLDGWVRLMTWYYVRDLRRVSNQNHKQYGDCIVHLIVQNDTITRLSLGSSQSQAEVQLHSNVIVQLSLILNRYESCFHHISPHHHHQKPYEGF